MAIQIVLAAPVSAQNAAGVFGPVVDAGERAAEYRLAFDPETDNVLHRFHAEASFSGALLGRLVTQVRKPGGGTTDFDSLQAELWWQMTPDGQVWQSGLRADFRVRDENRPEQVGLNWSNQWRVTERLTTRLIGSGAVQLGENRAKGVFLQTRASAIWRASSAVTTGIEVFNVYGSTANFRSLDEQRHQAGPFVAVKAGSAWQVYGGVLAGLTGASPDATLRLRIGRSF